MTVVPSAATAPAPSFRVLIVDDSATARFALRRGLESEGFEVQECENPIEVPFHLWKYRPQVVILDLEMPSLSGKQVFDIIRDASGMGHQPHIIFHSSFSQEKIDEALRQCEGRPIAFRKSGTIEPMMAFLRRVRDDAEAQG